MMTFTWLLNTTQLIYWTAYFTRKQSGMCDRKSKAKTVTSRACKRYASRCARAQNAEQGGDVILSDGCDEQA